ncbi:MAG: IS110 family transposase [Selenomonadales bacterium]|jgi:transposase|nr:IS110 family transposase [Selenomonadales bacterium]
MTTKLFAGIDISANDAVLCFLDQDGNQLGPSRKFANDFLGANQLLDTITTFSVNEVHIGLEATSVYGVHLRDFLAAAKEVPPHWAVYEINPSLVAGFKKSFPKRPKTDHQDAWLIAERVRFGRIEPFSLKKITTAPLLQLTRHRLHLIELVTTEQNRACNMIFLKFSNYRKDNPFSNTFGKASSALLRDLSPDELVNMDTEQLVSFIAQNGNHRLKDVGQMAADLKNMAKRAYRLNPKIQNSINVTLTMTLHNIDFFKSQIKRLDKVIAQELQAIPQTLTTIPGIGPVWAAGLTAEIGDISRFRDEAALAQYAGLTWSRYQSGDFDAEERRLTKTGNRYLRYYLVEAANSLRVHNEEYKAYYQVKYQEVTKHQHKRALVLTARKFVRLVFALLSKGQIYTPACPPAGGRAGRSS